MRLHIKNQNKKLRSTMTETSKTNDKPSKKQCTESSGVNPLLNMENKMGKENINKGALKDLLNKTRNDRKDDAPKLTANELLQKYPALLNEDLVSRMLIYINNCLSNNIICNKKINKITLFQFINHYRKFREPIF